MSRKDYDDMSIKNDAYALFKLDDMEKNYNELMNTMFKNGWTTGEDIFVGSDDCFDLWYGNQGQQFPMLLHESDQYIIYFCFANLRVCDWNQTNDPRMKDGFEFEGSKGCSFAWPNFCVTDQPFKVNSPIGALQRQAQKADSKTCRNYPSGEARSGWGGADTFGMMKDVTDIQRTIQVPVYILIRSFAGNCIERAESPEFPC